MRNVIYDKVQDLESDKLVLPGIGVATITQGCYFGYYFTISLKENNGVTYNIMRNWNSRDNWRDIYRELKEKMIQNVCPLFKDAIKFKSAKAEAA